MAHNEENTQDKMVVDNTEEDKIEAQESQQISNSDDLKKQIDERLIGKPVSGKPWKKISKPSNSKVVKIGLLSRPFQKKKELYEKQKELRAKIKLLKADEAEKQKQRRLATEAKRKRKEENTLKSSQFQIVKNTDKVRKWSKKARAQLAKLPSSMFESLVKKEYNY